MRPNALPVLLLFSCHTASAMVVSVGDICPHQCTCELTLLSDLPISSVFIKSKHETHSDNDLPLYHQRNEVLDEEDEKEKGGNDVEEEKLKAATCVLNPSNNLPLFLSLPDDLQALAILQGPATANMTLDKTYFNHLKKLVVLEIHGFLQHGNSGILRLKNDVLKPLESLKYVNIQHVHLQGEPGVGNQPAPVSELHFRESGIPFLQDIDPESNLIPGSIELVTPGEDNIIPYDVYREEQDRAGLSIFSGHRNLVFLRVFHCNIKEVSWEMFDGLQKLQYLSLEGNDIPFLHEFSFYGTPNLKHLTLSHNKLLNIRSTDLAGLLKLEILDLSYNYVSHLTELSLPPFPQLNIADFHHNPLELILPHTFHIMNNTEKIYLGGNSAPLKIRPNSFLGLDKVLQMSLKNLLLSVLEKDYLKGMPKLRELKIEGVVDKLAFDAFTEVPNLQVLIMKHCSIKYISMDTFFYLYDLMYLDLSHNELEVLPPSLFDHQRSLKEIILHHNKLTTLPEDLFLHTPTKLIRLDKNPWHCTCMMSEWQPAQINKIKYKIVDDSRCQTRYDKGNMCKIQYKYQYVYDRSVGPRCATPTRFSGWSVFHLLRKHLRCSKIHKNKHLTTKNTHVQVDSLSTVNTSTQANKTLVESTYNTSFPATTPMYDSSPTQQGFETVPIQTQVQENELSPMIGMDINQNMWTDKDRRKFTLLREKEERIFFMKQNLTESVVLDGAQSEISKTSPTKYYKKSSNQKKWQLKMDSTIRNLNNDPLRNEFNSSATNI